MIGQEYMKWGVLMSQEQSEEIRHGKPEYFGIFQFWTYFVRLPP